MCLVDLDGDGAEEEISYSADRDEYDYADSIVIHCDGNSYDTAMFMDSDYYGGCGYSASGYLVGHRTGKHGCIWKQWEKVTVNICRFLN